MAASNFEFFTKGLSYLLADLQHAFSSIKFDTSGFDNAMHLLSEQTVDMGIAIESATKAINKFTDTLKNAKIPSGGGGGGGTSRLTDEEKAARQAAKEQKAADRQVERARAKADRDAAKAQRDNARAQRQADRDALRSEQETRRQQEEANKQQVQTARDVLFQHQGILKNVSQFYSNLAGAGAGGGLGAILGGAKSGILGGIQGLMTGGARGGLRGAAVGFGNGAKEGGAKGMEAGPAIMQGVLGAMDFFSKSLSLLTAPIHSLIGGFSALIGTVVTLVQAFNPALVQQFNATIKDLMAIFGAAFTPLLVGLTALFRALADSLIPIITGLRPAFENLGKIILQFLVPVFQGLLNTVAAITPVFNQITSEFQDLASNVGNIFKGLIEGLVPFIVGFTQTIRILLPVFNFLAWAVEKVAYFIAGPLFGALTGLSLWFGVYLVKSIFAFNNAVVVATASLKAMAASSGASAGATAGGAAGGALAGGRLGMLAGPWGALIGTAIGAAVGGLASIIGSFFTDVKEQKFGLDNSSYGAAARSAEYTTVEQLSANLIKSAFSGSMNDKLGQLVGKANEQVELLQVIANKPVAAGGAARGAALGALP